MNDPTCAMCVHFVEDDQDEFGECRRFPPVYVQEGDESVLVFPSVNRDIWCGEFQRRVQ